VDRRGSPAIPEKRQETAGPDWPAWVLRNSPANRTDDLYSSLPSDWLQRKSLARKIRSLVGHAVPSTRLGASTGPHGQPDEGAFVFVADFSLMHVARCDTGVIVFVVR